MPALGLQNSIYSRYKFVEIGRGDAGFYQQEDPHSSSTLSALFLSTPAVLHMRGYNRLPYQRYIHSRTLAIRLSTSAREKLLAAVASSFSMDKGIAVEVSKGKDERSRFYQAKGSYHMFYTCNNWTAEMIELADYPVKHRWAFFADSVMDQIESVQQSLGLACRDVGGYQCE